MYFVPPQSPFRFPNRPVPWNPFGASPAAGWQQPQAGRTPPVTGWQQPQAGRTPPVTGWQQQTGRTPPVTGWRPPQTGMTPPAAGWQPPQAARTPPAPAPAPQPAPPPVKKAVESDLKPDAFTASGLTQKDLDEIVGKFGAEIDDIFNLAPGQEWMFDKGRKVTNAFFIQSLMKVSLKLKPSTFRQHLDAVSLKRSNLRTAYAYRNQDKPYQVVLKNRRPELRFVDRSDKTLDELADELERFRAADRRRGFDLERDPLIRMTVFSTAEEDTYAIVLSQPHINHDGTSEMVIVKELIVDYALGGKVPLPEFSAGSYQDYAKWLESVDKEAELDYWSNLLAGAAETRLPGRVQSSLEGAMGTLTMRLDGKVSKLQQRYKATVNSVAQAAWGVMLQRIYGVRDVVFGSITSGRGAEVADSGTMTGGFVNAFPVRVTAEDGESFGELVRRTQGQIMRSVQMAHCSPDEIGERLGRKGPVFDHLLNFHNFAGGNDGMPAMPGLSILGIDTFDNLSMGFCLYFHVEKDALNCSFVYDRRSFPERKIRILMDCFQQVMEQIMADEDSSLAVDAIRCPDISAFITAQQDEAEERARLEDFLRGVSLFRGVDEAGIAALADRAEMITCTDGDVIFREKAPVDGLYLVMEGFVALSRATMSGWEGVLLTRKPGTLLSAAGVLEDGVSYASARAISNQVRMVHLSREELRPLMAAYPAVALNIISEQVETAKAFSFLWLNADSGM